VKCKTKEYRRCNLQLKAEIKNVAGQVRTPDRSSIMFSVIAFEEHLFGGGRIDMTLVCNIAQSVVGYSFSVNPLVATPVTQIKSC
jgi:hypothetical protein